MIPEQQIHLTAKYNLKETLQHNLHMTPVLQLSYLKSFTERNKSSVSVSAPQAVDNFKFLLNKYNYPKSSMKSWNTRQQNSIT